MESTALRRLALRRGYVCPSCIARCSVSRQVSRRRFHASPLRRKGVLETLEERGLVNQVAGNRTTLSDILAKRKVAIYAGIDPTAPSLHLGHLLPLMVLFWLHNHGHNVVSLVGGATSKIGDPSGRLKSREMTDLKEQNSNAGKMWKQTEKLWERVEAYGERHGFHKGGERQMLDNSAWLGKLKVVDFLRVLGTGTRLGTMLGRDTVRNKMDQGDGMSFAELAYPLLQGWDWWHMYKTYGVQLQVGGADQYGNIIAGMDAVRFISQHEGQGVLEAEQGSKEPMGLTVPLLTTSSGEKFGKSAGNAVWLSTKMTSAFDLYGFLLKTADADVERYLKLFTFVPLGNISELMDEHSLDPGKRQAQHLLASEVLELVHGPEESWKTKKQHESMRKPTLESVIQARRQSKGVQSEDKSAKDVEAAAPTASNVERADGSSTQHVENRGGGARSSQSKTLTTEDKGTSEDPLDSPAGLSEQHIILAETKVLSLSFATILYNAGLAPSKSEATRMIAGGGVYVARRVEEEGSQELSFVSLKALGESVDVEALLIERQLVLRLGKWKVRVIEVVNEGAWDCDLLRV